MTREDWLIRAADRLSQDLLASYTLPAFHISVGFPKGRGGRAGARPGECWPPNAARDGKAHIFVSPIRDGSESTAILTTVLHELIHAAVGTEHGHRGPFARAAKAAGLQKPYTSSTGTDETLTRRLNALAAELGPLPHGALVPAERGQRPGSRLRLYECECRVKVRVASDDFHARCEDCRGLFERRGG
jgi:hypothetical protein